MTNLLFEDSLIDAVKKYDEILEKLEKLEIKKEEIRENVKKWMKINNLTKHEIKTKSGKLYRITEDIRTRKSTNYDYLAAVLSPDELKNAINLTEYENFIIKEVKHKKPNINDMLIPKAPKEIID